MADPPVWTLEAVKEHFEQLRLSDHRAVDAAFDAAKEKSEAHNALISAMERQQATFVTKGQVYAALIASLAALSIVVGMYAAFGGGG